ncbi:MAG: sulfatase-like hydrolase/transferase, partial [Candidatus Scalindua sp.]|nr:sulfatase-like hydrolase/transferase [Candidatus Scalindua sp.]
TELLSLFLQGTVIWFCILVFYNFVALIVDRSEHALFKRVLKICIWTCFGIAGWLQITNLYYMWYNEKFLNRELVIFGFQQLGYLSWHLKRFSPSLLLIIIVTVFGVLSITQWGLLKTFRRTNCFFSPKMFKLLGVAVIVYIVVFNVWLKQPWQYQKNGIITMASSSLTKYKIIDVVGDYSLIPKQRKINYKGHSIEVPIIVICIESMRHDLAKYEPSPVPFLASLIPQSIFFERAYAVSSHSIYADVNFWHSQFPLRSPKFYRFKHNSPHRGKSVFEVFKALEYQTAYITSQNETWGGMINWMKNPGVDFFYHAPDHQGKTYLDEKDDGFAVFAKKIQTIGSIPDTETLGVARQWIANLRDKKQFFLGMNLQNTHYSYYLSEEAEMPFQPMKEFEGMFGAWPRKNLEIVRNRYLNAFYNVDKLIENFVLFLKEERIWDDCLFMVVGDNGEAFYEHGYPNHAGPMHDEVARTFALIKPPRKSNIKPATISFPVSHIDLTSGILDMLNISQPYSFQGISPFSKARKYVYLYCDAMKRQDGIIRWPWKLLRSYPGEELELYNLDTDPLEKINHALENKDIVSELIKRFDKWKNAQLSYYTQPEVYSSYYPPQFE